MDREQLARIEAMLVKLVQAIDRYLPLVERLTRNPFSRRG